MLKRKENLTFLTYKAVYSLQNIRNYLLFRAIDPLMLYLFFAALGLSIIGHDYIQFIIIGNIVFVTARMFIISLIEMFRYEKIVGTLGLNIVGKTSLSELIWRRLLIPFLDAIFVIGISFVYAYFLFGIKINISVIPTLLLYLAAALFSMASFALLTASISFVFKNLNLFMNAVLGVLQVFCGVNFSIYLFPEFIQYISLNLPLTNAIMGIRQTIDGVVLSESYSFLIKELFVSTCILLIGSILIFIMERVAKRSGALFES